MPLAPIVVVRKRPPAAELARFLGNPFSNLVKFVVDVERGILALGGELHADAVLIEHGSRQAVSWGGNDHPSLGEGECLEYTSLINIRPSQNNPGMEVQDAAVRERMRRIVFDLIGRGEPLP